MSDLLNTRSADVNSARIDTSTLRCQWCSVPLADGVTICPTCGSPGIPDPRMTVPSVAETEASQPDPVREALTHGSISRNETELVEWWKSETIDGATSTTPGRGVDFEEVERRRMQSIIFMGAAVLFCAVLGWLIGPTLLVGPFEGLTGTTVEDPSDLRGMGTMGGLIAGMFIGATGGWVIWSAR